MDFSAFSALGTDGQVVQAVASKIPGLRNNQGNPELGGPGVGPWVGQFLLLSAECHLPASQLFLPTPIPRCGDHGGPGIFIYSMSIDRPHLTTLACSKKQEV